MTIKPIAMRDALLERIWTEMAANPDIFFVTADFGSPVLDKIRSDFPKQFTNVGIAEQNLINVSAGLALEGYTVFSYAIAPFITMRCFEQIRVSLALLSEVRAMNVNLIGVGAGFSYVVSGPTHQCYEDLSLIRALPNFDLLSPADHIASGALFDYCLSKKTPKYLRLDAQVLPVVYDSSLPNISAGFNELLHGKDLCIVATGFMLHTALQVAKDLSSQGFSVGVIDLFNITTFNHRLLRNILSGYQAIVSLEEGFRGCGGMDAMLFNFFARERIKIPYLNLGVLGGYRFELGSRQELHEQVGIGPNSVLGSIHEFINQINL